MVSLRSALVTPCRHHFVRATAAFFNSACRRQFVGSLSVTNFFLPLKWLVRILATFHNNYMPAFLISIYPLTLIPVFRPTYLTHAFSALTLLVGRQEGHPA